MTKTPPPSPHWEEYIVKSPERSEKLLNMSLFIVYCYYYYYYYYYHTRAPDARPPPGAASLHTTPNPPTNIIPTKIAWRKLSGKFPMGLGIPPLSQTLRNP